MNVDKRTNSLNSMRLIHLNYNFQAKDKELKNLALLSFWLLEQLRNFDRYIFLIKYFEISEHFSLTYRITQNK